MIEDKKNGVKIATDPKEAFWAQTKDEAERAILTMTESLKINKNILELAEVMLKDIGK